MVAVRAVLIVVLLLAPVPAGAQVPQEARDAVSEARRLERAGDFEAVIEAYERAFAIHQGVGKREYLTKSARRKLAYRDNRALVAEHCEGERDCFLKFGVFGGVPLHPVIVHDMIGQVVDYDVPLVVAINVEDAIDSNKYCCETSYDWTINDRLVSKVSTNYADDFSSRSRPREECVMSGCWLSYSVAGATDNGVLVLDVYERGGGSMISRFALLLELARETVYFRGWKYTAVVKSRAALQLGRFEFLETHGTVVEAGPVTIDTAVLD